MKKEIRFITGTHLTSVFPKKTDRIWMSGHLIREFAPTAPDNQPLYAKVICIEPLKEFTFYGKVESLMPSLSEKEENKNSIYIDPMFLPKNELLSDRIEVEIQHIDIEELQPALSITLELPEEKVVSWSEDEVLVAQNRYKTINRLVFYHQQVILEPETNLSALASVTKINPDHGRSEAFKITKDTAIHLEGLPENMQKVINFDKIGGLEPVIRSIREIIQIPLLYPELLAEFDIRPPKGLLLHGPPGNGKTMIAKAIAYSMGAAFISIEGPELNSKYVGVGQQRLREKFEEASAHKQSVIFIDEIDSIAFVRDEDNSQSHHIETVSTLLNLMDGINSSKNVFVIGATNRLNAVDPALRRPGRFELEYEITLPDRQARLDILQKNIPLEKKELWDESITSGFLNYISEITNGYSGADLISLYRLSVMQAIRRHMQIDPVTGKMILDPEKGTIRLKDSDIQATVKQITPTSLRGSKDAVAALVSWDALKGMEKIKSEIESIHQYAKASGKSDSPRRHSCMNLIFKGDTGSGRKTFIRAFATHFAYEMIHFDGLDYITYPFEKIVREFEKMLGRSKHLAPSVLYLENLGYISEKEVLLAKVKNSLSCISNRFQILTVIAADNDNYETIRPLLTGYKGFNHVIEFPKTSQSLVEQLGKEYNISGGRLEKWSKKELPIGVLISEMQEQLINPL